MRLTGMVFLAAALMTPALSAEPGDLKITFPGGEDRRGLISLRYRLNRGEGLAPKGTAKVELKDPKGTDGFVPKSLEVGYHVESGDLVADVPVCRPALMPAAAFAMKLSIGAAFTVESKRDTLDPTPATDGEDPKSPCASVKVRDLSVTANSKGNGLLNVKFTVDHPGKVVVQTGDGNSPGAYEVVDTLTGAGQVTFPANVTDSTWAAILTDPGRVPLSHEERPSGVNAWTFVTVPGSHAPGGETGTLNVAVAEPDDQRTGKLKLSYTLSNRSAVLSASSAQVEVTPADVVEKRFVPPSRDVHYKVQGNQLTAELPFCHPTEEPVSAAITLRVGSELTATSNPVSIPALSQTPDESETDANCAALDISRLKVIRFEVLGSQRNYDGKYTIDVRLALNQAGAAWIRVGDGDKVYYDQKWTLKSGLWDLSVVSALNPQTMLAVITDPKARVDPRSPVNPSLPVKGEPSTWPEWILGKILGNFLWLLTMFVVAVLLKWYAYPFAKALIARRSYDKPKAPPETDSDPTGSRRAGRSATPGIGDPATLPNENQNRLPPGGKTDGTISVYGAGTPPEQTGENRQSPEATAERRLANKELANVDRGLGISSPQDVVAAPGAALPRQLKPEEYEEAFCAALTRWWQEPNDRAELIQLFEKIGIRDAKWVDIGNMEEAFRSVKWTGPYEFPEREGGGWIFWRAPGGKNMALPADPACFVPENALQFAEKIVYGLDKPWEGLRFRKAILPCNLRSTTDVYNGRVVYHVEVKGAIQCAGRNLDMVCHYRNYEALLPKQPTPPRPSSAPVPSFDQENIRSIVRSEMKKIQASEGRMLINSGRDEIRQSPDEGFAAMNAGKPEGIDQALEASIQKCLDARLPGVVESVVATIESRLPALIKEFLGVQQVGPGKAEALKEVETGLKGILDSTRETQPQQPAATSVSAPLPTPAPTSSAAPKTESTQTDAAPPQTAAASPTAEAEVHKRASNADSSWPEERLQAAYNKAARGNGDRERRLESLQKALASHFEDRSFEIHHLETTDGTNYTKKNPGSTPEQHFVTAEIGSDLWVFVPAGPFQVWEYSVAYNKLLSDPKAGQITYITRPARLIRRNGTNTYAFADALVASKADPGKV
jgi:hypothetical protein